MNFIDKLERKFGWFGVPNLMRYIIALNIAGTILLLTAPEIYYEYLSLDIYRVLHGQVWRLFTFVLNPIYHRGINAMDTIINMFWFVIWVSVYYFIGTSLERIWGKFRFTLLMFSGWLFIILISFVYFFILSTDVTDRMLVSLMMGVMVTLEYLYRSLFLAFALMFPEMEFLMYFIIPVKAKWLAVLYLFLDGYTVLKAFNGGDYFTVALVLGAVANVVIFTVFGRGKPGMNGIYREQKRRVAFQKKVREAVSSEGPVHRCVVCGRTELDAPDLHFRYCSKCQGNYEYCSEHLYTHEHVQH